MHFRNSDGGKKKGRNRMQYIDNINKLTRASLEENIRVAYHRTAWHKISYADGAANARTDDGD